jgi:hypothetical protein
LGRGEWENWLATLTAHIPNAGEHLVRYYAWYSHVNRGKRRKAPEKGEDSFGVPLRNVIDTHLRY